uniref:Uncharacterized protein n=1 Tax=Arundo donax TaxID=35708 RepID=A0A0A9ATI5_ARUDO
MLHQKSCGNNTKLSGPQSHHHVNLNILWCLPPPSPPN